MIDTEIPPFTFKPDGKKRKYKMDSWAKHKANQKNKRRKRRKLAKAQRLVKASK